MEKNDEIRIRQQVERLFYSLMNQVTIEGMKNIRAAFELALDAHRDQYRKTGEPYIIHPVAVATIVAQEFRLGTNPVIAAFLHDVVEDTHYTLEDIRNRFGDDVAFLVDTVTKKQKVVYETSKQVDNFKQMLGSMQYDIRALLIKLADRLHNMRTLSSMPLEKQMKIAGETDYFYAPLANRLGFYYTKIELENLSFLFRCPEEYNHLQTLINEDKVKDEAYLPQFVKDVKDYLLENKMDVDVTVEYRTPYSIRRMMNKKGKDYRHLAGRHIVKIVYSDSFRKSEKEMCLQIYSLLTSKWKERPGSFLNYVDSPKENGYKSVHVKLMSEGGIWEEVHIFSASTELHSKIGCVAERRNGDVTEWIEGFKQTLKDIAEHSGGGMFMDNVVSAFYNDDIIVFGSKGEMVRLPQQATALDFAFECHARMGVHAQYARINGKICSIFTPLKRGDCVFIGTNDEMTPKPEYLNHVLTYRAKRVLQSCFRNVPVDPLVRCPFCNPIPGDEVIGFRLPEGKTELHTRSCATAISKASKDGDAVVKVDFQEDSHRLYPVTIQIAAVDRKHLLIDMVDCVSNRLGLNINSLNTSTENQIVDCVLSFEVHSWAELRTTIDYLYTIPGVEEVACKQRS